MIEIKTDSESGNVSEAMPPVLHPTFDFVNKKLKRWLARFSQSDDLSIFNDLYLFYLLASKKYLDHRNPNHLFRIILSIYHIQKKQMRSVTFSPHLRHLEIRWLSTSLRFPFSSKPVLGCLIGFNVLDRYELFDEENVLLALQKYVPELRLVKDSSYSHSSTNKNFKLFYFEIEKKDGTTFSLREQNLLKDSLEGKVKNSIQKLSPSIYMGFNEEDTYKNILVLSQEIHSLKDLPQAHIILDQQNGQEIIFKVILVFIAPSHRFSLKEHFYDCTFVPQRNLTVRHLDNHPVEAHLFRLHIKRGPSLLRADGSLDFYSARQKVANIIKLAIGEFRDYNGGIIIKQQEHLHSFKNQFPEIAERDPEMIESFFYAITPIEQQLILSTEILSTLFKHYLTSRKEKLPPDTHYRLDVYPFEDKEFIIVRGNNPAINETVSAILEKHDYNFQDIAYNIIDNSEGVFFNCILVRSDSKKGTEQFVQSLKHSLDLWHQKIKNQQTLRVAVEFSIVSLDPRIGGEAVSSDILRLLFEGLTRYDQNGKIENGIAETIEIANDQKQYIFKLRPTFWNDGSPLTAYDFEYAWKKILSPSFKTSFAHIFYSIKNAKAAKEGTVTPDKIGINAVDDRTLKVDLEHPNISFLQLTAYPLFSPINQRVDQQHPQWPYQSEKNYPCNGPFQLKINQANHGYKLVKNPFYWDSTHVALDQITLTQMTSSQALQAFHRKEVDWVGNPFGVWNSSYTPQKDDHIVSFADTRVCWCVFNTKYPPFHNKKLRQAMAYAIERAQITAHSATINPAFSVLLPYYHEKNHPKFPSCSIEKSRQLLREALQELDLSLEDLPPLTLTFHEKGMLEYAAQILGQQLRDHLGIKCELQPLSWNMVFNKLTKGNFQMGLVNWISWIDDPLYSTLNYFKSANQETNFAKWENEEFKHLLEISQMETNPFKRSSNLIKAEEIICTEVPVIPLFYQPYQALVKKDIQVSFKKPCGPFNIAKSFYNKGEYL